MPRVFKYEALYLEQKRRAEAAERRANQAETRLDALTRTVMAGGIIMDSKGGKNFNCGFYCESTLEDLADAILNKEVK